MKHMAAKLNVLGSSITHKVYDHSSPWLFQL